MWQGGAGPPEVVHQNISVLVLLVSGELHLVISRVWGAILELVLVRETA